MFERSKGSILICCVNSTSQVEKSLARTITSYPSLRNNFVVSKPIPLFPPVINTVFFIKALFISYLLGVNVRTILYCTAFIPYKLPTLHRLQTRQNKEIKQR